MADFPFATTTTRAGVRPFEMVHVRTYAGLRRRESMSEPSHVGKTRPAPTEAPAEAPTAADAAPVRKRAKKTKTDPLALACQTGRHLKRASSNLLIMP